ncbi:grasp-with-spasm system SPASM domain peptide maturase [Kordia jejudonensis]|uniref:grasp-with-spasm system SPASM domain peptide maturase n=1 Tax=Kordia jejudonensis TaxID=1348245 RepID=UPI000629C7D5|nr:grasp-with-spasm system SPASM domain peptide maturase [Kordia jejudonensis]
MSTAPIFNMHSNCIIVKGANRSTICDLQRNEVKLIPNDLQNLIEQYEGKTNEEIKAQYNESDYEVVDEYLNFLVEHEYAFFTNTPEFYPKLNIEWFEASKITNAIIDINSDLEYDVIKVLSQLDDLNCKHVQIRFFNVIKFSIIIKLLDYLNETESIVSSINFVVSFTKEFSVIKLVELFREQPRISSFLIYNHTKEDVIIPLKENHTKYIKCVTKNIKSASHCGVISQEYFVPNIKAYTESLQHNSCLNRKISIDTQGNIKNCPSMSESYGNIENTTLEEALHQKDFKKYWNITKDQIEICKDCEFRYICTDCRAYRENPEDNYSKPLKCGYDPYTNEWSDWSKNPLKQKAIEWYNL